MRKRNRECLELMCCVDSYHPTRLREQSRAVTKEPLWFFYFLVLSSPFISHLSTGTDSSLHHSPVAWMGALIHLQEGFPADRSGAGLDDGTKSVPFQLKATSMPSVEASGEGRFAWNAHNGWQSWN